VARRRSEARAGSRGQAALFLGPGILYWIVLFLIPVALILVYSFFQRSRIGGFYYTFTLDNYLRAT
jgi:spermidine/putrescine transport system permease protein